MNTRAALNVIAFGFLPAITFAAPPSITAVSGTVQTNQVLAVSGTSMVEHNTTNWFKGAAWDFEGSTYQADGYVTPGGVEPTCTMGYDSTVRLMGAKSMKYRLRGAFSGPSVGICHTYVFMTGVSNDFYVSAYVRYDASAGGNQWPNNYMKLLMTIGDTGNLFYFQPAMNDSSAPTRWLMYENFTSTWGNNPSGPLQNGRWYHIEAYYKNSSPKRYQAWVDGVQIGDWVPQGNVTPLYMLQGIINQSATTSTFDMTLNMDRFVLSNQRIYPASKVEIGNNPDYAIATKVYQEPIFLSDGSIQVKANLTGLGTGPYYLWVTNNLQERSQPYALTPGAIGTGDNIPPSITLTAPGSFSTVTGSTNIAANASDNVGVLGVQFRLNGNNVGSEDTSAPYSYAWNTTTYANGNYTVTATARDAAGNTTTSSPITVTVSNAAAAPTVPTVSLSPSPTTVTSGQSSTLTWSTTNATGCTASGAWSGTKALSGSETVAPTQTSTYTLACTGAGGTTTQSASVNVTSSATTGTTFIEEGFENNNFASRGWYDLTTGTLDTAERYSGNSSLRCSYTVGGTNCIAPKRHKFPESDSVYVGYRVKYSTNFVGSGQSYHPHEFQILSNLNGDYDGLAFDYLTLYLESHWNTSSNGFMFAGVQDGQNIDQSRIGQNLIGVTENRGVAGCNGSPSGFPGTCYNRGDGIYVNGVLLPTTQTFTATNKNSWNHVEAYFKLNSITNGVGQADGIIRVWFNDALVLEKTNAILRTGQRPTMKLNQLIFGPWIGDGSPVSQTLWLDDLVVASERPAGALLPPLNPRFLQ